MIPVERFRPSASEHFYQNPANETHDSAALRASMHSGEYDATLRLSMQRTSPAAHSRFKVEPHDVAFGSRAFVSPTIVTSRQGM